MSRAPFSRDDTWHSEHVLNCTWCSLKKCSAQSNALAYIDSGLLNSETPRVRWKNWERSHNRKRGNLPERGFSRICERFRERKKTNSLGGESRLRRVLGRGRCNTMHPPVLSARIVARAKRNRYQLLLPTTLCNQILFT